MSENNRSRPYRHTGMYWVAAAVVLLVAALAAYLLPGPPREELTSAHYRAVINPDTAYPTQLAQTPPAPTASVRPTPGVPSAPPGGTPSTPAQ
jgi:hypothetical protein